MAGKMCSGTNVVPSDPKESKAYCEGRRAAIDGALIGDNPLPSGSPSAIAWGLGFQSVGGGAALPRDCCADLGSGPV